jgi:DNA invertase Pin-like site-specific DNA recombinase
MKLVAYLRVSTDKQAEEGLGLDVQRHAIREWAKASGHTIRVWATDEGQSGSNGLDTRKGLLDALSAVQDGRCGGLVVYRLDRLARDLVLQEQLLSEVWRGPSVRRSADASLRPTAGARVFSTSPSEDAYLGGDDPDDPSRAMIRQILGAVAQYERGMIRLRLRQGKARKLAQGGYVGGAPRFGFRAEGAALVPDEREQLARTRIVQLRAEGLSLRAIVEVLEAEGIATKRGGRWHPTSVRSTLSASI